MFGPFVGVSTFAPEWFWLPQKDNAATSNGPNYQYPGALSLTPSAGARLPRPFVWRPRIHVGLTLEGGRVRGTHYPGWLAGGGRAHYRRPDRRPHRPFACCGEGVASQPRHPCPGRARRHPRLDGAPISGELSREAAEAVAQAERQETGASHALARC
jgi:hypothetical protein